MAKNLADRLEALSGYKHVFPPGGPQAQRNPVNNSYLRFKMGGRVFYLLSRIADAGLDYTHRTNKIAHHIVLSREELAVAGPACLASQVGFFETTWEGEPRILPAGRTIPQGELRMGVCNTWARLAGDAGWAGVLAESFLKRTSSEAYLICKPGTDALSLFLEAQSLLPTEKRWDATFSTYFSKVPPGVECRWRCVIDGTPEAVLARRSPENLVIDLTASLASAEGGSLVVAARTGRIPQAANVETPQPIEADVEKKKTPVPPSVPWQDVPSLEALPPALPQQRRVTSVPQDNFAKKEKPIWKVAALAGLVVLALVVGASIRFFWPDEQLHKLSSVDNSSADVGNRQESVEIRDDPTGTGGGNTGSESKPPGQVDEIGVSAPEGMRESTASKRTGADEPEPIGTEAKPVSKDQPDRSQAPPKDVLSGIVQYVDLPSPRVSLAGEAQRISLGSLQSNYSDQVEMTLIGVSEVEPPTGISLQRNATDSSKWELLSVSENGEKAIAEITISPPSGGSKSANANLTFDWHSKASKLSKKVIFTVRRSGIRFRIGDVQPTFLCFRPDESRTPGPSDALQLKKKVLLSSADSIPLGQAAVLQYCTSISINGKIDDSATQQWIFDDESQPQPIDFKLGGLKLKVACEMNPSRIVSVSFALVQEDKSGKDLDDFLKELKITRRKAFLDALKKRIDVLKLIPDTRKEIEKFLGLNFPRVDGWTELLYRKNLVELDVIWSTLESKWEKDFPDAYRNFQESIDNEIGDHTTELKKTHSGNQQRKTRLAKNLEREIMDARQLKDDLKQERTNASKFSEALSAHQVAWPHLISWIKTRETLEIHLQISRQLSIPGEENQDMFPLVPIYRAGTPIESVP